MAGDGFSLGYAMVMMMIDAVIYGILTWYIEAVMPGTVSAGLRTTNKV